MKSPVARRHRYAVVATIGLAPILSGCWVMPGQGPSRTGNNEFEERITPDTVNTLEEIWTGAGSTQPVVSRYGVVVGVDRFVRTYDAATGALRWSVPSEFSGDAIFAGEIVVDGDVLQVTDYGVPSRSQPSARGLDAATGRSAPAAVQARVDSVRGPYVAGVRSDDYADTDLDRIFLDFVDRSTEPQRQFFGVVRSGSPTRNPPVTLGIEHVYVTGPVLVATSPGDGSQGNGIRAIPLQGTTADCGPVGRVSGFACPTWATPLDGTGATSAVISDDYSTLYVGTDAGAVYALDAATGAVRWSAALGSPITATPTLVHDVLLVPAEDGRLHAFAAGGCGDESCVSEWWADTGGTVTVQAAPGGGVVFAGSETGHVRAFDAAGCGEASCQPLWATEVGSATTGLAVTGGRLFVTTADSVLLAYQPAG